MAIWENWSSHVSEIIEIFLAFRTVIPCELWAPLNIKIDNVSLRDRVCKNHQTCWVKLKRPFACATRAQQTPVRTSMLLDHWSISRCQRTMIPVPVLFTVLFLEYFLSFQIGSCGHTIGSLTVCKQLSLSEMLPKCRDPLKPRQLLIQD